MLFTRIRTLDNECWTGSRAFEIKEFYKTGTFALFNPLLSIVSTVHFGAVF